MISTSLEVRSLATKLLVLTTLLLVSVTVYPLQPIARAGSEPVNFEENDILSVFHIAKSQNRNQVHYGIHVDELCRPVGAHPVFVYWREFEKGPTTISGLLDREQPIYGIREQRVQVLASTAGRVRVNLGALPDRAINVESFRDDEHRCIARALIDIKRERCILRSIYVNVGTLFSVDKITLIATTLREGAGTCAAEVIRPYEK
jgi:hypothetical protein